MSLRSSLVSCHCIEAMFAIFQYTSAGMVETEFSIVRFRGDKAAADKVYQGLQPCKYSVWMAYKMILNSVPVTAQDIAEEIVWAASRPAHVNLAEVYVLPVNQASPTISYRGGK